jgi:hypothetical protein
MILDIDKVVSSDEISQVSQAGQSASGHDNEMR